MGLHKIPASSTQETGNQEATLSDVASESSSSADEEETWDDWISDPDRQTPCRSLFDDRIFSSPEETVKHDKAVHNFDINTVCRSLALDFHSRVRLINYIRKEKSEPHTLTRLSGKEEFLSSDVYLQPVIEDDPLLLVGVEDWSDEEDGDPGNISSDRRVRALERKLAQAKQDLAEYRKLVESRFDLSRLAEDLNEPSVTIDKSVTKPRDDDTYYFGSYGENDIHAVMIQDKVRTSTYASFILTNPLLFQDATVLDVGCGTGILSLFAARAGAKRVFAVDASDVAEKAKEIVKANKLDNIITVIRGKIEEITLPGDVKHVDIIVSEWMGYALLYESMLDSVLHARDRFLRPGGVMIPTQCRMMLGLCQASEIYKERIEFWSDVYGFDLSSMAKEVYEDAIADVVGPESMVSEAVIIKDLHIPKISTRQLDFVESFTLHATSNRRTTVHAFLLYFDTFFTTSDDPVPPSTEVQTVKGGDVAVAEVWRVGGESKPRRSYSLDLKGKGKVRVTSFSTGPPSIPTHWKQTIFLLREPVVVEEGTVVSGEFHCRKSQDNSRELDVEIHYTVQQPGAEMKGDIIIQTFKVR
ncbi:protein arginine N-methyltransferase [Rickenella mellea]|uniref:type I protein arginine methyltransferase n=1 Tax=Rickenella mellea TaxID=50990 RepID=A0A4Y7PX01_9AGAM|nr:protein arginine N-methyltransferase [Rickenella mellea]